MVSSPPPSTFGGLPGRRNQSDATDRHASTSGDSADSSERPIPSPPPPPLDSDSLSPLSPAPRDLSLRSQSSSPSPGGGAAADPGVSDVVSNGDGAYAGAAGGVAGDDVSGGGGANDGGGSRGPNEPPGTNPKLRSHTTSTSTSITSTSTTASFPHDDGQSHIQSSFQPPAQSIAQSPSGIGRSLVAGNGSSDASGAKASVANDADANGADATNVKTSANGSCEPVKEKERDNDKEIDNLIEFVALYGMNDSVFAHTTDSSGGTGGRGSGGAADDDSAGDRFSDINVHSSLHGNSRENSYTESSPRGRNMQHRDGVWSGSQGTSGDSGDGGSGIPSRPTLHFSTWLGEPLQGRLIDTHPPLPTGTEEDDNFRIVQQTLQMFVFPQGVKVVSKAPPEPTYHSWVFTDYWVADLTATYYHCATVWKPVDESKLSLIKLREGAALLANTPSGLARGLSEGSAFEHGDESSYLDEDEMCDAHERLRQLETLFEPQVICIVTKVPYHISFEKVLRSFVDPLYRDTASCTLTRDDLVRLEGILRMTPMRPAASPTGPMMIDVKGVACSIPQPETINWELAYGARCLEVDMAPLFTHLQPSNVIRLYTHIMLERYVCVGLVGRSVGRPIGWSIACSMASSHFLRHRTNVPTYM